MTKMYTYNKKKGKENLQSFRVRKEERKLEKNIDREIRWQKTKTQMRS